MNFKELFKDFIQIKEDNFPFEDCDIAHPFNSNIFYQDKDYLCVILDTNTNGFSFELLLLKPAIVSDNGKDSFIWIYSELMSYVNNPFNSFELNAKRIVYSFKEFKKTKEEDEYYEEIDLFLKELKKQPKEIEEIK